MMRFPLSLIIVAVAGAPGLGKAQELPPAGYSVRARVSTCAPYNPSSCQYKTVFLKTRAWCGKREPWWTPTERHQVVTVACQ